MRSKRDSLWLFKNTATVLVSEILHTPGSKALKSALVLVVCQRSHIAWFTEYADSGCRVSAYIIGQCVHGRRPSCIQRFVYFMHRGSSSNKV